MSLARPHPGSFPRTHLPALYNLVKACPSTVASILPYPAATRASAAGPPYLYVDDLCFIVPDAFPKSTVHLLVVPRDASLASLNALTPAHVALLQHMASVAANYTRDFVKTPDAPQYATLRFISGFHAIPSLPMLHMHHLSMDLESSCLKHKKHYNSFATRFFLPAPSVIADLEKNGRVTLNQSVAALDGLEHGEMRCLWCGLPLASMPVMKSHVPTCPKNGSRGLPLSGASSRRAAAAAAVLEAQE